MNAASNRGKSLAALASSVSGLRRYLNPRKNQRNPKYVSAISIAAPIHHHIQNLCVFVARCIRSNPESVLTASPKAFAAILSTLHSLPRANAGHRGCVLSR